MREARHVGKMASLMPRAINYSVTNDDLKQRLISHGLPVSFDALSVGTDDGQLALIPLDESSRENAVLITSLWNKEISESKRLSILLSKAIEALSFYAEPNSWDRANNGEYPMSHDRICRRDTTSWTDIPSALGGEMARDFFRDNSYEINKFKRQGENKK